MATQGKLRHCIAAGVCSAAEETYSYSGSSTSWKDDDERSRLNGAEWRCPYGTPDTDVSVELNQYGWTLTADLHCERLWLESVHS